MQFIPSNYSKDKGVGATFSVKFELGYFANKLLLRNVLFFNKGTPERGTGKKLLD